MPVPSDQARMVLPILVRPSWWAYSDVGRIQRPKHKTWKIDFIWPDSFLSKQHDASIQFYLNLWRKKEVEKKCQWVKIGFLKIEEKKIQKVNLIQFAICRVQKTIDNTSTIFLKTMGTMKAMIWWTGSYGRSLQRHFIFPRAPHKVQDLWRDSQMDSILHNVWGKP